MDLGVSRIVVVSSSELMKQLFKNPVTNGRKDDLSMESWKDLGWGMFFRTGDKGWRMQRKQGIRAMSLFGSAKNSRLSAVVAKNVETFKTYLEDLNEKPIELREPMFKVAESGVRPVEKQSRDEL